MSDYTCHFCGSLIPRFHRECLEHNINVRYVMRDRCYSIVEWNQQRYQVIWDFGDQEVVIISDKTDELIELIRCENAVQYLTPDNVLDKLPTMINFS